MATKKGSVEDEGEKTERWKFTIKPGHLTTDSILPYGGRRNYYYYYYYYFVLLWFQIFFVCWKGLQNNCHISDPIEPQWEIRGSLGYNEYSDGSFPRNVPLFTAL